MSQAGLLLLLTVVTQSLFFVTDAQSCNACNCQFNNVQVLSRLAQAEVNQALAGEPRELPVNFLSICYSYIAIYYHDLKEMHG